MSDIYLFVYGSLRPAWCGITTIEGLPQAKQALQEGAVYIGRAKTKGLLYDIGHYPGLVVDAQSDTLVIGDLFLIKNSDILGILDAYEGCHQRDPQPHEYQRIKVPIQLLTSDKPVTAWLYHYALEAQSNQLIASGDWLAV